MFPRLGSAHSLDLRGLNIFESLVEPVLRELFDVGDDRNILYVYECTFQQHHEAKHIEEEKVTAKP